MTSVAQLGVAGRLAFSAYGVGFYVLKTILPVNLLPLYEAPVVVKPSAPSFLLSYAAVFAITAVAVALRRRVPAFLAAWAAYLLTLLPVLGIFQNGPQLTADRYTYLACMGWAILGGAGLFTCWHACRRRRARALSLVPLGLAGASLALLALLTWTQIQVWRDTETLWTYTLSRDPHSSIAHNNLGARLLERGRLNEALQHFEEALRISPKYAGSLVNVGIARALQGNLDEGIERIQRALRIEPDNTVGSAYLKAMLRLKDQQRSMSVIQPTESPRPAP